MCDVCMVLWCGELFGMVCGMVCIDVCVFMMVGVVMCEG